MSRWDGHREDKEPVGGGVAKVGGWQSVWRAGWRIMPMLLQNKGGLENRVAWRHTLI